MKKLILATMTASMFSGVVMADTILKADSLDEFFSPMGDTVTEANYPIHETARQNLKVQDEVGINNFKHKRHLTPTEEQHVVRMNRDTYYSFAVVDVSEGATITLPEFDGYMTAQVITEDHRIQKMLEGSGTYELKTHTGDYVHIVVRLDSRLSEVEAAKVQDAMHIDANSSQPFEATPVMQDQFYQVEEDLKAQVDPMFIKDPVHITYGMFTDPTDESNQLFDQDKYEVASAMGWGGAQLADNIYEISGTMDANQCYSVTFEDPKNDSFWSWTVYDAKGFMFNDSASLNSHHAAENADGTYTINFGCGDDAVNNITTTEGNKTGKFTLAVRHYDPSQKVIDGYRLMPMVKEVRVN